MEHKPPEKKEHSLDCNKIIDKYTKGLCVCEAGTYNQAIDDMHHWITSAPIEEELNKGKINSAYKYTADAIRKMLKGEK